MGYHGKYTPEFKKRAVDLYHASGKTFSAMAAELGIDDGTLSGWVRAAEASAAAGASGNPFQREEELRQLRREVARLREENEILLKASAFFASRSL